MPVIGIPVDMLLERIQTRPGRDEMVEHLQHLGCDVEGYAHLRRFACQRCSNLMEIVDTENPPLLCDRCGTDFKAHPEQLRSAGENEVLRMELLAVRPDMFDPGGLARTLRNYFKESLETPTYPLKESQYRVVVDPSVAHRPWIACAVVRNFNLTEDRLRTIMKLQENLHWALGRDRKRASIGVYNLDSLHGTEFRYTAVTPEQLTFAPLGFAADKLMTPAQILTDHPKGTAYARLLTPFERYPVLFDQQDQVMALIPIINSEATKLTPTTRNFFIDVTGLEERIVNKTLNTLVTSLAELDPTASLEQVQIAYEGGGGVDAQFTPNLAPQLATLDPDRAVRYIGIPLERAGVVECLKRMGHRVEDSGEGELKVWVPAYRNDIMHEVDLIEDVAIAYGYHNIETSLVPTLTVGQEQPLEVAANAARSALTGLGFFEVMTLILSSEEQQFDAVRRGRTDQHVVIDNPISWEQTMIRVSLLPGLLDTLAANTDHEMPQRIFEIGNTSKLDSGVETGARELRQLSAAAIGPRVDFSYMRSVTESVLREFGYTLQTVASEDPLFIPGRGASLLALRGEHSTPIGVMGEIHPEVLERFKLVQPASVFELSLELLSV